MKIKREILGQTIEIELTKKEIFDAYCVQEYLFDVSSCRDYLSNMYCEEPWYEDLPEEIKVLIVQEAACNLRRNLDKYEMSFEYAISDAFWYAFKNHYPKALEEGDLNHV